MGERLRFSLARNYGENRRLHRQVLFGLEDSSSKSLSILPRKWSSSFSCPHKNKEAPNQDWVLLYFCAGRENRTPVLTLARSRSTTKPCPQIYFDYFFKFSSGFLAQQGHVLPHYKLICMLADILFSLKLFSSPMPCQPRSRSTTLYAYLHARIIFLWTFSLQACAHQTSLSK